MGTILFSCERCRCRLKVPSNSAGKNIRCPKCRGQTTVPEPEDEGGSYSLQTDTPSSEPLPKPSEMWAPGYVRDAAAIPEPSGGSPVPLHGADEAPFLEVDWSGYTERYELWQLPNGEPILEITHMISDGHFGEDRTIRLAKYHTMQTMPGESWAVYLVGRLGAIVGFLVCCAVLVFIASLTGLPFWVVLLIACLGGFGGIGMNPGRRPASTAFLTKHNKRPEVVVFPDEASLHEFCELIKKNTKIKIREAEG